MSESKSYEVTVRFTFTDIMKAELIAFNSKYNITQDTDKIMNSYKCYKLEWVTADNLNEATQQTLERWQHRQLSELHIVLADGVNG